MLKHNLKPLAAAVGVAFMASIAVVPMASAAGNPFQANELSSGYNLADSHSEGQCGGNMNKALKEGTCGEGKCGESKAMKEGTCGESKAMKEGTCGESKAMKEGTCGESKAMKEGKCGEKK